MSSFYEKLSMRLQGGTEDAADVKSDATPKSVTYRATGDRAATPEKKSEAQPQPQTQEKPPEGTDPIDIDLFQSDLRMVIYMKVSGVPAAGLDVTISEESNTMVITATQKRPELPPMPAPKAGEAPEKGIYVKQEIKWKALYRKIYLPAPFDASSATSTIANGIIVINLPAKRPGAGKKLNIQEVQRDDIKK